MLLGFGAYVFSSAILPEARALFAPRATLATAHELGRETVAAPVRFFISCARMGEKK